MTQDQAPESPQREALPTPKRLSGLQRVLRAYGRMRTGDVMWAWDYAREEAVHERVLLKDRARHAASEKARAALMQGAMDHAGRKP